MAITQTQAAEIRDAANECPTAWFCLLERSLDEGDLERAALAQRELERLGVTVVFRRRPQRPEVRHG